MMMPSLRLTVWWSVWAASALALMWRLWVWCIYAFDASDVDVDGMYAFVMLMMYAFDASDDDVDGTYAFVMLMMILCIQLTWWWCVCFCLLCLPDDNMLMTCVICCYCCYAWFYSWCMCVGWAKRMRYWAISDGNVVLIVIWAETGIWKWNGPELSGPFGSLAMMSHD